MGLRGHQINVPDKKEETMSDREKEIREGQEDTEGEGMRLPVGNTDEDVEGQGRGSNG